MFGLVRCDLSGKYGRRNESVTSCLVGIEIKFTRTTCKSFTKLTLLCYKVYSFTIIHFLPSPQTLCDGGIKHLAEAPELLTCCVPALRCRPQNGGLGVHRSGYHKDRSSRLLSRDLGGWWVRKFHPTVAAHPLYTDRCRGDDGRGLSSSPCYPNLVNCRHAPTAVLPAEFCTLKYSSPFSQLHSAKAYKTNTTKFQSQC
jgi:hypothetical protein